MTRGILAAGAYIPFRRMPRSVIAAANSWLNPSLKSSATGSRSLANWDEDAVTMAVAAARDAGIGAQSRLDALNLASTTAPFLDRLNAGIVAEALGLPNPVSTSDCGGSQRAGTTALAAALLSTQATAVTASEQKRCKAGSASEIIAGDGAAAIFVGDGNPIAVMRASATHTADFVDHYRSMEAPFDYGWEERWVRDAGYLTLAKPVIEACLKQAGVQAGEIRFFCAGSPIARATQLLAKSVAIPEWAVFDPLQKSCGHCGSAHPLMLLAGALEQAKPGDLILVMGFGQGVDAIVLQATPKLAEWKPRAGLAGHIAHQRSESQYLKLLAFNDVVEMDRGMRAEVDKQTQLSALWRNRETVTSFIGGECRSCGTRQFPRSRICVNPDCNAIDTQSPYPFANAKGRIRSFTADHLTYSPDPPACYGMVEFDVGGRWMMDFTDIDAAQLEVAMPVAMTFRIKDIDQQRGFRRYFWKATADWEQS